MTSPELLGFLIGMVGCFVGLAGWLSGREKKISNDAEWRGVVNTKLDLMLGCRTEIADVKDEVNKHGERISMVERDVKSAHHRLDNLNAKTG